MPRAIWSGAVVEGVLPRNPREALQGCGPVVEMKRGAAEEVLFRALVVCSDGGCEAEYEVLGLLAEIEAMCCGLTGRDYRSWDGRKGPMKPISKPLDSCSSHLAPPQSEWVFLPRLGGCESLGAALLSGRRCGLPAQGARSGSSHLRWRSN